MLHFYYNKFFFTFENWSNLKNVSKFDVATGSNWTEYIPGNLKSDGSNSLKN